VMVCDQAGPVDILVNNAGIPASGVMGLTPFRDEDPDHWADFFDVNGDDGDDRERQRCPRQQDRAAQRKYRQPRRQVGRLLVSIGRSHAGELPD